VNRIVPSNLEKLLEMDYPYTKIIIVLPMENMRGQQVTDEPLAQVFSHPSVHITRPQKDYGPIMKYIGFLSVDTPDDSWVWVCDDDQQYKPAILKKCIDLLPSTNPTSTVVAPRGQMDFMTPTVRGFAGVLIHKSSIRRLTDFVDKNGIPESCSRLDDNYVSIVFKKLGIQVIPVPFESKDLFVSGVSHEHVDSLHKSHFKIMDQWKCCSAIDDDFTGLMVTVALATVAIGMWLVYTVRQYRNRSNVQRKINGRLY